MRKEICDLLNDVPKDFNNMEIKEKSIIANKNLLTCKNKINQIIEQKLYDKENGKLSDRQSNCVLVLNSTLEDIYKKNIPINLQQKLFYKISYYDLYWNIWDYFYDYGNNKQNLFLIEVKTILPYLESAIEIFGKKL